MSDLTLTYETATGAEVARVADKLEVALEGESDQLKMMGCMAYAILTAAPGVPSDILSRCITDLSERLAIFLMEEFNKANPSSIIEPS